VGLAPVAISTLNVLLFAKHVWEFQLSRCAGGCGIYSFGAQFLWVAPVLCWLLNVAALCEFISGNISWVDTRHVLVGLVPVLHLALNVAALWQAISTQIDVWSKQDILWMVVLSWCLILYTRRKRRLKKVGIKIHRSIFFWLTAVDRMLIEYRLVLNSWMCLQQTWHGEVLSHVLQMCLRNRVLLHSIKLLGLEVHHGCHTLVVKIFIWHSSYTRTKCETSCYTCDSKCGPLCLWSEHCSRPPSTFRRIEYIKHFLDSIELKYCAVDSAVPP
jgi:hypothetical protein